MTPLIINKLKKYSKLVKYLFISVCIGVIFILTYYLAKLNYLKFQEKFEDNPFDSSNTPMPTGTVNSNSYTPEPIQKQSGCPNTNDIISICTNYEGCCNNTPSTDCYCKHPAVSICASEYSNCMTDTNILSLYTNADRQKKCNEQRGICCSLYNNLTDTATFKPPVNMDQSTNQLCQMTLQKDIEIKCANLCKTNKECAAYSVGKMMCKQFSTSSPEVKANVFNKSGVDTEINYYSKL